MHKKGITKLYNLITPFSNWLAASCKLPQKETFLTAWPSSCRTKSKEKGQKAIDIDFNCSGSIAEQKIDNDYCSCSPFK